MIRRLPVSAHIYLLVSFSLQLSAQRYVRTAPSAGEDVPEWASMMYSENPNVWKVDDLYRNWRQTHPDLKTTFTQYYKKWRHANDPYIDSYGFIHKPTDAEQVEFNKRLQLQREAFNKNTSVRKGAGWTVLGPLETFNTNTGPDPLEKSSQVNVYCFDQSISQPDVLYCGTEGGEIYKSTDHGNNWFCVSRRYAMGAPTALEIHPTNSDIVFAGENDRLRRSIDGGDTWEIVLTEGGMSVNDIKINPGNDSIVLVATQVGLYRSNDGGNSWAQVRSETSYDIEWKVDDASISFLVSHDPDQEICRFYKSVDAGLTWEARDNGWFFSDEEGRHDGGARLAVTNADPDRVYAVLIGEARTGDSGFIGIWRSDDAGESWTLPNPPAGGPWNETDHPNMATIGRTGGYQQGFYNLGFDASDQDPNFVMAGFLSLWYSVDGAATFTCFGGYCGNNYNYVHPDCQEIEINGSDIWMTSDGGIEYSNDYFVTHHARNRGITGSDFWGFGTGWNEDILVGGRYHNGNSGWYENWMPGECLSLGGGEAATGYVNPGAGRKTYFSDIGGVVLPEEQDGYAQYFQLGKYPNESYYDAESGEMEWDPRSWNTFYVSHENKLWRTADGGASWQVFHEFGTDENARIMSFEVSRSNPDVIYAFQRDADSWTAGKLWRSIDGGQQWEQITLPPGYARRCLLAVDAEDEHRLWLAYPDGDDTHKIFTSFSGGESWENMTTPVMGGEHITYILHQGGTDGAIYLGTSRTIWFRDDTMNDWMPYDEGLPVQISTCILRPFYRDHKIRLGAYGKGIWEAPFAVSSRPIAQPMINKTSTNCPGDTIHFDDFSMLSHDDAQWAWEFPGGVPETSALRNPHVVYHAPGKYDVTLTVTNPFGTSTKTVPGMIEILEPEVNEVPPQITFSGDEQYYSIINPDDGVTWEPVVISTCNPEGDTAIYVHNYVYSSYGVDAVELPMNLDLTQLVDPVLQFRVAYAPYYDGNAFIDSMKVLLTNNCGTTWHIVFSSGGEQLSTTTSGEGPNNLYEYQEFSPQSCDEWRDVTLDLSAYAGQYVTIRFVNYSGYGNNMYLDDIALTGGSVATVNLSRTNLLSIEPNPVHEQVTISSSGNISGRGQLKIQTVNGVLLWEEEVPVSSDRWSKSISLTGFPDGVYVVTFHQENGETQIGRIIKQ